MAESTELSWLSRVRDWIVHKLIDKENVGKARIVGFIFQSIAIITFCFYTPRKWNNNNNDFDLNAYFNFIFFFKSRFLEKCTSSKTNTERE